MPFRSLILVLGATAAVSVQPVSAQMPAKPAVIREMVSQAGAPGTPAPSPASISKTGGANATVSGTPQGSKTPAPTASGPRRDPFDPLLNRNPGQGSGPAVPERLPPGKAGLMIGTLHIEGLVQGPNGMIAIVSNPELRVYFLHEGDRIFDGRVTKITMEAVSFQQIGRDADGKATDHEVVRRLYPNPGEQR